MLVNAEDQKVLLTWINQRLEKFSDADSEVLADYVIALVTDNLPDEELRKRCLENLEDFLGDNTRPFLDELFQTIQTQSYLPANRRDRRRTPTGPSSLPKKPSTGLRGNVPGFSAADNRLGKRPREGSEVTDAHRTRDGRVAKQRKGPRQDGFGMNPSNRTSRTSGSQAGFQLGPFGAGGMAEQRSVPMMPMGPGMPPFPPDMPLPPLGMALPPFQPPNPNDPMAVAFMGMLMQFQEHMAEMERLRQKLAQPTSHRSRRCRAFDQNGFCRRGAGCPYQHIRDEGNPPEAYDPSTASLTSANGHSASSRRGRVRGDRGRALKGRAPFSMVGEDLDDNNTTIVVEQIPEEHFTEQAVREYFSEFGDIVQVDMQPYKRLAIVKYGDHASAYRAWKSPKTIFENRFVKVYWFSPESEQWQVQPTANGDVSMTEGAKDNDIDMGEFTAKQLEAQKVHEEKMKKLKEAEAQREEIDRKLREQAVQRKKLLEELAARTGTTAEAIDPQANGRNGIKTAATEALKAKLAALEEEAASIGLDPAGDPAADSSSGYRGRGRGGYRGRGFYPSRGRGHDPFRGSPSGRGGYQGGSTRFSGVMRLDNRPKRVSVTLPTGEGTEWVGERDEALRSHLFNNYEFDSIDPHPDRKDSMIVAFKERYVAESFMENSAIPGIGQVEMSWVPNAPATTVGVPQKPLPVAAKTAEGGAMVSDARDENGLKQGEHAEEAVADAEGDDRWMDVA